ncbi:MAG TPA: acyltransferase, partial [Pirellulales bacterium]|nr:acyltransferase [Pirellulales bacterium]
EASQEVDFPASVETNALPSPASSARYRGLDVVRTLAMLCIIWIHVPRSPELRSTTIVARFAVPLFACVATYFAYRKGFATGFAGTLEYVVGRVRRVYLPFVAWSVVYLLFKAAKKLVAPEQDNDFAGWDILWTGGAYHLWFLPFIFMASSGAYLLGALAACDRGRERRIAHGTAIAGGVIASLPSLGVPLSDGALSCMLLALPAACWGTTWAGLSNERPIDHGRGAVVSVLMFLAFVLLEALLVALGRNAWLENLAGVALAIFAMAWLPGRAWLPAAHLGTVAFGMYCSHLLFVKVAESAIAKLHLSPTPAIDAGVMLWTVVGCVLTAWALSRCRLTRWMVV